jgi:phospholipid/cholesterol/gamma-HCH transport system substrate-binding protein
MKHRDDVLVGVVVTIGFIVLLLGSVWLVRGGLQSGYPLYARFPWGSGIKQGQSVLLSGVDVGFVGDVDLRPDGTLIITLRINKQYHVPQGTTATIEPNGIFGDVDVALRPARPTNSYIAESDTIPNGRPSPTISDILASVDTASGKLNDVAKTVEVELVQGGGIADLHQTLQHANHLVAQLSDIAAEQSKQLSASMHALNRAVTAIDSAAVDSTVQNLKASSANMANLTDNLKQTTVRLNSVLAKVDSGGGTAGRIINDPAIYNDVHALLARFDSLTADLKNNPKRYINVHLF